jgi:hypothetical protein
MIMEKRQKIKSKIERRLKNKSKYTGLNIDDLRSLRQEIIAYQFHFSAQPPWNESSPQAVLHQYSRPMNKEQQHRGMEGNHDQ